MTLVKAIDLFDLLRAADAHLGVYSTVLTDAVAAGTPNLIVASLEGTDLLGYVEASVARPVGSGADLLAALEQLGGSPACVGRRPGGLPGRTLRPGARRPPIADDLIAVAAGQARETDGPGSRPADASS